MVKFDLKNLWSQGETRGNDQKWYRNARKVVESGFFLIFPTLEAFYTFSPLEIHDFGWFWPNRLISGEADQMGRNKGVTDQNFFLKSRKTSNKDVRQRFWYFPHGCASQRFCSLRKSKMAEYRQEYIYTVHGDIFISARLETPRDATHQNGMRHVVCQRKK